MNTGIQTAAEFAVGWLVGKGFTRITSRYAAKGGLSTTQLVQKSATLAERAVGGTGRFVGTAKHTYANNLLSRYQSIYGSRGLQINDVGNRGFLDVVNHGSKTIYDFKFV